MLRMGDARSPARYRDIVTTTGSSAPVPPVRWGIVGASDIADRVMAPAMAATPSAALVAIASRSAERARAFALRHGVARTFESAAALALDPDIDAVYVATEVDRHAADVLAVARAGKDVLVEKPIARTAAEGQTIVDGCATAGVRLGTCFYQRYNARHRRIGDLLADGAVGRVAAVQVSFSGRSPARAGAWREDPGRSGGGPLIDTGSHAVDLLRWLFGEVDTVTALVGTVVEPYDVEDTAFTLLRMRSGVMASLATHWSTADSSDARTSSITIGGTEGTIVSWPLHDKFSRGMILLARTAGDEKIHVAEASTHVALLDDFAAARAAGRPFPISGADGVAAQRAIDAAYTSARDGRTVRL